MSKTVDPVFLMKRRERLGAKKKRLASLERRSQAESNCLAAFPMGPGCGRPSSRSSHYRSMDASVTQAGEIVSLHREISMEEGFLQAYEAGKVDKQGRRRPLGAEQLEKLIETGEKVLATGLLKGVALTEGQREALKETLRDLRKKLRKSLA